jgi:hypothetical protein
MGDYPPEQIAASPGSDWSVGPTFGSRPRRLLIVFDDYAGNIQQNQEEFVFFAQKPREFTGSPHGRAGFSGKSHSFGPIESHSDALPAGLKLEEESARGRDHCDVETGPGIGFGAACGLGEVAERAMHMEGPIAHAQQDRRAFGMGHRAHGDSLS